MTIDDAPAIAWMAAVREGGPAVRFSPLVLAKPGSGPPPFFLVHSGDGTVMQMTQLGKLIDYAGPVYAIQARGLDGIEAPANSIDEMAADYLKAVSEIQSRGPYLLAGHCDGGLIAFSMAQRLAGAGQKVAFLGLLDSYPAPDSWPFIVRLEVRRRVVQHRLGWLLKAPLGVQLAYIRYRLGHGDPPPENGAASHQGVGLPPAVQAVRKSITEAFFEHRPIFYPGKINFIQAARAITVLPHDPGAVWRRYAAEIEVQPAPGDHNTMVEERFAAELAKVLSHCIKAAPGN